MGVLVGVNDIEGEIEGVKDGVADAGITNCLFPNTNPGSIRPSCGIYLITYYWKHAKLPNTR